MVLAKLTPYRVQVFVSPFFIKTEKYQTVKQIQPFNMPAPIKVGPLRFCLPEVFIYLLFYFANTTKFYKNYLILY